MDLVKLWRSCLIVAKRSRTSDIDNNLAMFHNVCYVMSDVSPRHCFLTKAEILI